ncbi:fibronectin type III domain-containing protein [uncultured Lacinutrix sp.]|uniref:fibronectin type III domain-containing protein n=1 Tax=uncultured Lacinutrix sp. TaxID=574032 RepID=UPI002609773B|nr:fibronectin type III domain-containing protein [uncultured Lacinutrix sp.]
MKSKLLLLLLFVSLTTYAKTSNSNPNLDREYRLTCLPDNVSIYNIAPNAAEVSWTSSSTNTTLRYVQFGFPFSFGTDIINISGNTQTITGLNPNTSYDVYLQGNCNGTPSAWTLATNFTTLSGSIIYVNHAALGADNGTTWNDAFLKLEDALAIATGNDQVWVAQGTYVPTTTNVNSRKATFNVLTGTKVYGGFNATETTISERDVEAYLTILSGDLNGDDNSVITDTEATRQDNAYHVVSMRRNISDVLIDGFTISGGNANGSTVTWGSVLTQFSDSKGAAIYLNPVVTGENTTATIQNCILEKNSATNNSVFAGFGPINAATHNRDFTGNFTSCIIKNNYSLNSSAFQYHGSTGQGYNAYGTITNSLFYDNTSVNGSSCLSLVASTTNNGNTSGMNVSVINSTFANNTGVAGNVVEMAQASNSRIRNSIIYDNGSTTPFTITTSGSVVSNSIVEGGQQGAIDVDPLFINSSADLFQLNTGSPAIDAGDNSYISNTILNDISGGDRFVNTIVDMGAYEYGNLECSGIPTNINSNNETFTTVDVSWTPGGSETVWDIQYNPIGTLNVVLVSNVSNPYTITGLDPNTTYNIVVRASCVSSSGTYSSNGTFTTVNPVLFVDDTATGLNNGSSWTDAFNNLEDALAIATNETPVWVAKGTYKPSTLDVDTRKATYVIPSEVSVYGGFNGTETNVSQREPKINTTILSGDLNGDDNANILDTEATRQDNSYHVVSIRGNAQNVLVDGFTITSGNANGTANNSCSTPAIDQSYDLRGGAIYVNPYVSGSSLTAQFKNCILENNSGVSVAVYSPFTPCGVSNLTHDVDFESCIIRDNYSQDLTAMLFSGAQQFNLYAKGSIVNSLFYNNTSANNSSCLYLGASTGGNNTALEFEMINSTLSNNIGVNDNVITMVQASNSTIENSIIYGNGSGTGFPIAITTSFSVVNNSIVELGMIGGASSDPLFRDTINNDYTLQASSPAINAGSNASLSVTVVEDLNGNTRIVDATVDMGAFEYDVNLNLVVNPKIFLQGAALNPNTGEETLMRDGLRVANLIPTTSPYTDALICNANVFTVTGNDAIVDWVWVELRDATTNTAVIASQSALLQRDGNIVGIDGVSSLVFNVIAGNYFVAIKHRNHLGIMTLGTVALNQTLTTIDFTDANNQITYGTDAQSTFGMPTGIVAMWAGDTNGDGRLNYSGALSDVPGIRGQVFNDPNNSVFGGPPVASYQSQGYYGTDVDMDGLTVYSGGTSDVLHVRNNIFNNPSNSVFGGPPTSTYLFTQQLPEGANN